MNNLSKLLLLNLLATTSVFASESITISGTVPGFVPIYQKTDISRRGLSAAPVSFKEIVFQQLVLSPEAKNFLAAQATQQNRLQSRQDPVLPPQASTDMSRFPVLDQGEHGTCVTFADTGALNSAYQHPDYISQLCNLELGSYLAKLKRGYPDGWDGSWNETVLEQITKYGVISITYQKKNGCSGMHEYPLLDSRNKGKPMTVDEFTRHSSKIMDEMSYKKIMDHNARFSTKFDEEAMFAAVKQAVAQGHHVVFGFAVDTLNHDVGAYGNFKASQDTWVMTPQIKKDWDKGAIKAGHAIFITGYDDNAVVKGPYGTTHKGVLALRNSWGTDAGDDGNYYMSYEYFKTLALEVEEIIPASAS